MVSLVAYPYKFSGGSFSRVKWIRKMAAATTGGIGELSFFWMLLLLSIVSSMSAFWI